MIEPPKSRSLNFTLEELLGLTPKENGGESVRTESNGRPPTRHGRESLSQAPESSSTSTRRSSEQQNGDPFSPSQIDQNESATDEEFLNKLNSLRRRSLVSTKLPGESLSIPLRTPMLEETPEFPEVSLDSRHSNQTTMLNAARPGTSESMHTFKVEESDEEKASSKATTNGKSIKSNGSTGNPTKPPPTRFTSSLMGPPNSGSAHERWLRQKGEAERERKMKEREREEKKKAEEAEKKKEAKKIFEKWKTDFEEKLKEKRQTEKQKKLRVKEEREEKLRDAEKTYQAWRRDKRERERLEAIKNEKKREKLEVAEKRKDEERVSKHKEAQSAFEAWCRAKADQEQSEGLKQREKGELDNQRREAENEYKKALADEAYATWLQLKEEEVAFERTSLAEGMLVRSASSIPWVPPSNTVPRSFTPTGRPRRRSLDAPRRASSVSRAPFATRLGPHPRPPPPPQTSTRSSARRAQSAKNSRVIRNFVV